MAGGQWVGGMNLWLSVQSLCPPLLCRTSFTVQMKERPDRPMACMLSVLLGWGAPFIACLPLLQAKIFDLYCCYSLEIPNSYSKLTFAVHVSVRSQLLFINDEPWCWYTVGKAAGFLFLSATLCVMQHSGKHSLAEVEETGTGRQDPSCTLSWWEPLVERLHWSVLFLQGFERTSEIKTLGGKFLLFKSGDSQTGWATLLVARRVIRVLGFYMLPCALFYLHTS